MITIQSLEKIEFDRLFEAFSQAFADYEMQLSKEELLAMITRRGFVAELSFGAFDDDRLVAFTLNGIGQFGDVSTAYDTGTGTIDGFRGQGLATRIFEYSIPFLKSAGVSQYLLEVLQDNTKAVSVYQKLGFQVSREFNYFIQDLKDIKLAAKHSSCDYPIQPIDLSWKEMMIGCWDFIPSWQNSFEAVARNPKDFKMDAAFDEAKLIGYYIFEPKSGDITQLAVHPEYRRKGLASVLLNRAVSFTQIGSVKAINTLVGCESVTEFLQSNGIPLKGKQFEMIKPL